MAVSFAFTASSLLRFSVELLVCSWCRVWNGKDTVLVPRARLFLRFIRVLLLSDSLSLFLDIYSLTFLLSRSMFSYALGVLSSVLLPDLDLRRDC